MSVEIKPLVTEIVEEIKEVVESVEKKDIDKFVDMITQAKNIFVVGAGRSLLVGKMFAMRLTQMGLEVHVVGEATAPAIREGDILIAISGSGRTQFTLYSVEQAKKRNVKVVSITAHKESPIAELSDHVIILPTKTKYELSEGTVPLGTMFELSTAVFLDVVATYLKDKLGVSEDEMLERHNVLE